MVDRCAEGWETGDDFERSPAVAFDHCVAHSIWDTSGVPFWSKSGILQMGGFAKSKRSEKLPADDDTSLTPAITSAGFNGCMSNMRINDAVSAYTLQTCLMHE